jgi:hypothetical protein
VIDVGALGSATPNSVWYFNGTTGTWSTDPVLGSVSAGSAPANAGAFRMGNDDGLYARTAAGVNQELLALGSDNLPRFLGIRYPAANSVTPATLGYVLNVGGDGSVVVASLASLGAVTKTSIAIDRFSQDVNGRRWIDFESRGITQLDSAGPVTLKTLLEGDYHGEGTLFATALSEADLFIELEVETLMQENDSPTFPGKPHKNVYTAYIRKLQYNSMWQLGHDFEENTALRAGFPTTGTTWTPTINLMQSGTANGDLQITYRVNWPNVGSSSAVPNAVWKLRIFGGGRFA